MLALLASSTTVMTTVIVKNCDEAHFHWEPLLFSDWNAQVYFHEQHWQSSCKPLLYICTGCLDVWIEMKSVAWIWCYLSSMQCHRYLPCWLFIPSDSYFIRYLHSGWHKHTKMAKSKSKFTMPTQICLKHIVGNWYKSSVVIICEITVAYEMSLFGEFLINIRRMADIPSHLTWHMLTPCVGLSR